MRISTKLKALRKKAKLSQEEFAFQIGVPYRTYQDWELGNRQPSAAAIKLISLITEYEPRGKK